MHVQPPPAATTNSKTGTTSQRLDQASLWLLEGIRPREVVLKASAAWGLKKRMAQVYVSRAMKQLTMEAWNKSVFVRNALTQTTRQRSRLGAAGGASRRKLSFRTNHDLANPIQISLDVNGSVHKPANDLDVGEQMLRHVARSEP